MEQSNLSENPEILAQMMFLIKELNKAKQKIKKLKVKLATYDLDKTTLKKENLFLALKTKKLETTNCTPRMYVEETVSKPAQTFCLSNSVLGRQKTGLKPVSNHEDVVKAPTMTNLLTTSTILKKRNSLRKVEGPIERKQEVVPLNKQSNYDYLFNTIKSRNPMMNDSLVESWIE